MDSLCNQDLLIAAAAIAVLWLVVVKFGPIRRM